MTLFALFLYVNRDLGNFHPAEMGVFYMQILAIDNLKKEIEGEILFEIDHLQVMKKNKIGLIGTNGVGKSTLLKIIAGIEQADSGQIKCNGTLHYLPQLIDPSVAQSGGEQVKHKIDFAFAQAYDLLLLDEPTTNLDLANIKFLQNKLNHYYSACIIVSHDRHFIEQNCDLIWEIADNKLFVFNGSYHAYEQFLTDKEQEQIKRFKKYQQEKQRLEQAIDEKQKRAARVVNAKTKSKIEDGASKPFYAKKQKKVQKTAKALETRLSHLAEVSAPVKPQTITITPPDTTKFQQRTLIQYHDFALTINNRLLIQSFSTTIQGGDKIALIGNNGSGKTTFLQALQKGENITIHPKVKFGYFSQSLDILDDNKTIIDTICDTAIQSMTLIRTMLYQLGFDAIAIHKKVSHLSGGERVRVSLIKILVSDVNVLLLDEPTNYLDRTMLLVLEKILKNYQGTIIFISHDHDFIKNIATKTWRLADKKLSFEKQAVQKQADEQKRQQDALMKIDLQLTALNSQLSIAPSHALEQEFQELLAKKTKLLAKEK